MCYSIIRTSFATKNDFSLSQANVHATLRKNILAITLTIICRIPGILATGEEWKCWPAEGKTAAYNISRLCIKNLRYTKETEKQSSSSSSCADSTTAAANRANDSANDTTDKGRARTGPRLPTVRNTGDFS
jgi:hypothetical protein